MKQWLVMISIAGLFPAFGLAQPVSSISLLANNSENGCLVYHDQPVVFTISIVNLKAFEDQRWNRKADRWLAEIHERYEKGTMGREAYLSEKAIVESGKRKMQFDTLGSVGKPWYEEINFTTVRNGTDTVKFPAKLMQYPASSKIALLDTMNSYYVLYGVSPAMLLEQQPGKYEVFVELAGMVSGKVTVEVLEGTVPAAERASEAMLAAFANFYLSETDLQQAQLYADSILALNAHSVEGFMLSGIIHMRKTQYREALADFQLALKHFYEHEQETKEPPELIIGMIQGMKEKIKAAE